MKFGGFYEHQLPRPWTKDSEHTLLKNALDEVELSDRSGFDYVWEGGVGSGKNIVAYSAICAHKMTYPTKQVSFIGYRDEPSAVAPGGKVITCCSDRSSSR